MIKAVIFRQNLENRLIHGVFACFVPLLVPLLKFGTTLINGCATPSQRFCSFSCTVS